MQKRILLVEDEEHLHEAIKMNLEMENYIVNSVYNGKNAISKFKEGRYDLVILDVMLPGINGFDICESIRLEDKQTPILFLTSKNTSQDRVNGLKAGGDDYLGKPFNLEELLLRSENLIKRSLSSSNEDLSDKFVLGDCTINFKSYEVISSSGEISRLTQRQLMLLRLLIEKQNQVVSRQEILEKIWGYDVYPSTRTIDNVILSFRKIFEKESSPHTYFKSVRGVGYKLTP
ncbi:MAG: response regulator transcription factor [Bacteroidota bacterium]|nr:response regulator transcription factor [Bacteroidota bacterium]